MKLMSKRVGLMTAAAFGLAASASVVSAAFVAHAPTGAASGNPFASQACGCVGGGQAGKVACFACCTSVGHTGRSYNVDPGTVLVCFTQCGLERRNAPCRNFVSPYSRLPGR